MRFILCVLLIALVPISLGCQPQAKQETAEAAPSTPADAHDHGHEDTGPHGGHLLHLSPSGTHAEWTHDDDSHLLTVYLDDFESEKISNVKFVVKVAEETEEFPLEATDNGWTISSESLMNHINMGEAAVVTLIIADDAGEHSSRVEAHEHHHH